jgi:hypothetical protein
MLRTLLRMKEPFYIARQEQAPLLREREAFLEQLLRQGTSLAAGRSVALRDVWIDEIKNAAQRWARQQRANPLAHSYKTSAVYFIYVAKKWLRFAGVLKQPEIPRMRFANEFDDFAKWLTEERGLSSSTVQSHQHKISLFLKWFSERHRSFAALRLRDVDDFLIFKGANGWSRKSACGYANSLPGTVRATSRKSAVAKRRYMDVLSAVRCPRMSPIVFNGMPFFKRWSAYA